MDVTKQANAASKDFTASAGNTSDVNDLVIVGGGFSALHTALETLLLAEKEGKKFKVVVLADKINSPALDGSNLVYGVDGIGDYDEAAQRTPQEIALVGKVVDSVSRVQQLVKTQGQMLQEQGIEIDPRVSMGYELVGKKKKEVHETAQWLVDFFGYQTDDFTDAGSNRIKFKGYGYAEQTDAIGQINAPAYQALLIAAIRAHGGTVITGAKYDSHYETADGNIAVKTSKGTFKSSTVPLLATGAGEVSEGLNLPVKLNTIYTGAMHIELSPEDAKKIFPDGKPMAFCDTDVQGDVIWGSWDGKVFTIGFGDSPDASTETQNRINMQNKFREILPDIAGKYLDGADNDKVTYSWGAMLKTANEQPIVGRVPGKNGQPGANVMAGWASRGIAGSDAAGQDFAKYFVNGDDTGLKQWESLNPECFAAAIQAGNKVTPKTVARLAA